MPENEVAEMPENKVVEMPENKVVEMPENEVSSLADVIKALETSVMVSGDTLILEVRRSHVVKDAMKEARKSKFKPTKLTKVSSKVSCCVISNVIFLSLTSEGEVRW